MSPLNWVAVGGADGAGYASTSFSFAASVAGDTPVIIRAHDEFGSSGGAFEGNYIAEGVTELTAFVRHDAVAPINFFVRFTGPGNFPGAVAVNFVPVLPNQWTPISIQIDAANPQFVTFENSDFNTIFSDIGHIQVGPSVPAALAGSGAVVTFDIDSVSIVPEPATLLVVAGGALCLVCRRRRTM